MRKLFPLLFSLLLAMTLLPVAYAADPATPADPALVASLLPEYTLVEGNIHDNEMRLLLTRPDDALVFVGAVQGTDGAWALTESTPLPEGTILGVENFVYSLGIPASDYYHAISVSPFADGTWGITQIYPRGGELFSLGQMWISEYHAVDGTYGIHPWSDLSAIDWGTLPASYKEAAAQVDIGDLAVVNNPNPADRLHLRAAPSRDAESLGKYYNRTPIQVLERGEEWSRVRVGDVEGWMMTQYLAFDNEVQTVAFAGMSMHAIDEQTSLYARPGDPVPMRMMDEGETFYVIGLAGSDWYHIWLPRAGEYAYVLQTAVWKGNG